MDPKLTPAQDHAYGLVARDGHLTKGNGVSVTTVRVLAALGKIELAERRNAQGVTIWWKATLPVIRPQRPQRSTATPVAKEHPTTPHRYAMRTGVTNPHTGVTTWTSVQHVADTEELRLLLAVYGVPRDAIGTGTGGHHRTTHRQIVWRELGKALREFVCGGVVYSLAPHPQFADTWAATRVDSEEIVAADPDPDTAQLLAEETAAGFYRALRSEG